MVGQELRGDRVKLEDFSPEEKTILKKMRFHFLDNWKIERIKFGFSIKKLVHKSEYLSFKYIDANIADYTSIVYGYLLGYAVCSGASPESARKIVNFAWSKSFWLE